jgi:TetR/AcrR family transcriptional repressor of nem operon
MFFIMSTASARPDARIKLLEAALAAIRERGFAATSLDELCRRAGVTKGAFFHHFASKEALGVAAADHWSRMTGGLFASAPYHAHADPLDRVLGYIDFRKAILGREVPQFTCLVGTMVQEAYGEHPAIRDACRASIEGHAQTLVADIEEARRQRGIDGGWTAQSLALHTQAVIQGAFILAKAQYGPQIAADSLDHLRRYIELLFGQSRSGGRPWNRPSISSSTATALKP